MIYPYDLAVGQALLIRDGMTAEAGREIRSNGYAYPFISPWVLEQTLPYLTELSVFSYGFTAEGGLVDPLLDDQWMIGTAFRFGTRPILTLTPLGADGTFDNRRISAVVRNETSRSRLIENLIRVMKEKGYQGLDIDFEYILAEDRDSFTEFVQVCADAMHREGYSLSVALAPKTSADQPGLLYEGKDYRAIGAAADSVLLMTYEWGYTYGPPMAVAPLASVRRVLDFAVSEIPANKIYMGMPNYGYDWTLPYKQGETRAQLIGNEEAIEIARRHGAEIHYDEAAATPYFNYSENGNPHEVWFEDARSWAAKLALIPEYGFVGAGIWNAMRPFTQGWLILQSGYRVTSFINS